MPLRRIAAAALALVPAACGASPPADAGADHAQGATAARGPGSAAHLPGDILRALGTDEAVLACAAGVRDGVSRFAPDWVTASRPDFDGDGRADWLVAGAHACLQRGGLPLRWGYLDHGDARERVLRAPATAEVELLPAMHAGLHDLRLQGAAGDHDAQARWTFDGSRYGPSRQEGTAGTAAASGLATVAGALDWRRGGDGFALRRDGGTIATLGPAEPAEYVLPPQLLFRSEEPVAGWDEVLVLQESFPGNACNGGPLWVVALDRDGGQRADGPLDFCGGAAPAIRANASGLEIVVPGGPRNRVRGEVPAERWHWRGEGLRPGPL
ncbi:hypothetical protein [Coralloluteibacterium stylophorae]|uniref:VCBS repeat-containing protein n=1 Tax=Coralloluteibacterium stylophorae TaxID=1776034 RepID=A0A8J8AZU0_9GAMM|nr:hypothetical protein [Coralloluteibacterium stylophorae]MBS7458783.1 hypothetical protein [Coralloluteibacterium stylophorae]